MQASNPNRSSQIVFRLRAAFVVIVLLLLLAAVMAGYQMRLLDRSQTQAIEISVPALFESQRLESFLGKLLLQQGQIRTANSTAAVSELSEQISALDADMNRFIRSSSLLESANSQSRLTADLKNLNHSYTSLLPTRIRLNELDATLLADSKKITKIRQQFSALIQPRLIDNETSLYDALDSLTGKNNDPDETSAALSEKINNQNRLTEISFRFLALLDSAEQISRLTDSASSDSATLKITVNIRSLTQQVATLPQDDFRAELASLTNAAREAILGDEGIVPGLAAKASYQMEFNAAEQKQAELINLISKQIGLIVSSARSDIAASADNFENTLFKTIATFSLIGLLITAIIATVSYFVVERQINHRLSDLTGAVLDIASGDTSRSVEVSGGDEIGRMADSLEVFKNTAVKLRTSNEELEQFAYAASHDLKSPLRAIENLAQWTIEDGGSDLPADCHNNLEKILQRAKRLATLQNDLLEYSRAGHAVEEIKPIDINLLVAELSDFLDPESRFAIDVSGAYKIIHTSETPLRQVFMNLLNNAIKHHDRHQGTIKIDTQYTSSRIYVSVLDDGPGIEEQYLEQIFELFNMLQTQDEVEGSGLGLALVRKLVNRYGGVITAVSNPTRQRGTEFRFDWPIHVTNTPKQ